MCQGFGGWVLGLFPHQTFAVHQKRGRKREREGKREEKKRKGEAEEGGRGVEEAGRGERRGWSWGGRGGKEREEKETDRERKRETTDNIGRTLKQTDEQRKFQEPCSTFITWKKSQGEES